MEGMYSRHRKIRTVCHFLRKNKVFSIQDDFKLNHQASGSCSLPCSVTILGIYTYNVLNWLTDFGYLVNKYLKNPFFFLLFRIVLSSISAHKVRSVVQQPRRFQRRFLIFKADCKRLVSESAPAMRGVLLFKLAEGITTYHLAADHSCGKPAGLAWEKMQSMTICPLGSTYKGKPRTGQYLNVTRSYLCIGQPHWREVQAADLMI